MNKTNLIKVFNITHIGLGYTLLSFVHIVAVGVGCEADWSPGGEPAWRQVCGAPP